MSEQELFEKALISEISFLDFDLEILKNIGVFLGTHKSYFQSLYKAYRKKEEGYENKPQIGAKVSVHFFWKTEEVEVQRGEIFLKFSFSQFLRFLGLVDLCFAEIYPVGSVVELDIDQLPEEVQVIFRDHEPGALVVIAGRRVSLKKNYAQYFMDYIAYLWPFGEMDGQSPLVISNMLVNRLITSGLTNEFEKDFAMKYLREKTLEEKKISFAFIPESEIVKEYNHGE